MSVLETVGAARIMGDMLADRVVKKGLTNCINPTHDDEHPSMSVDLEAGLFHCFACGVEGGCFEMGVLRGLGRDHAEVAKAFEEKYHVNSNGHAAKPENPWPYYPKTAAGLGWEIIESYTFPRGGGSSRALRLPTWMPDGSPARFKIRGERDEHGNIRASFEPNADDCGVINWPAILDHIAGCESPSCAMVAGETDLLAWTWACKKGGWEIPAFSMSTGESSAIGEDYAAKLKDVRVYLVYDNDAKGREGAAKNIAALQKAGAKVTVHFPPDPHKDTRDFVQAGGNLLDLLKEEKRELPFAPISALDLLAKELPKIEELVSPRILYRGGVTVLVASHKRGKSLAALALCIDLVLNISAPEGIEDSPSLCPTWLGQPVVGRGPVLVYSAEGGERMIQERLRRMVPHPGEEMRQLFVYAQSPAPQLDKDAEIDAVFAHAEAIGAVLLVFDPLGRFWAMEDEADPTAARDLMLAIQSRAERAYDGRGIAVLANHHDTKAAGSDTDSAVTGGRGSGKFGDDADALINLKVGGHGTPAGQSKAMFLLRHAESPAPVTVQIEPNTLRLTVMSADQIAATAPKPKSGRPKKFSLEMLEELIRRKGRIEARRIAGELDLSMDTWKKHRKEMLRELCESGEFAEETEKGSKTVYIVHLPVKQSQVTSVSTSWGPSLPRG